MRKFGTLIVAAFLFSAVGCGTTVEGELWIDPCGGTCLADEVCWDLVCVASTECGSPYEVCAYSDGSYGCTDTMNDPFNCGGCGIWCDTICAFGACEAAGYTCADYGLDDCGNGCVDTSSDVFNCGGCGAECVAGDFCAAGLCGTTCAFDTCGDLCTDLLTDPYNCGQCGFECVNGCDGAGACL
jgi:hypothetical protein